MQWTVRQWGTEKKGILESRYYREWENERERSRESRQWSEIGVLKIEIEMSKSKMWLDWVTKWGGRQTQKTWGDQGPEQLWHWKDLSI